MRKKVLIVIFVFLAFVIVNATVYAQEGILPEDFQIRDVFGD